MKGSIRLIRYWGLKSIDKKLFRPNVSPFAQCLFVVLKFNTRMVEITSLIVLTLLWLLLLVRNTNVATFMRRVE